MATPNVPEISAPARRGLNASIGITANYGSSGGNNTTGASTANVIGGVGGTNNSIGGIVTTGVISSNSFPVNQASMTKTNSGGASFSPSHEGSVNPLSMQAQVTNEASDKTRRGDALPFTQGTVQSTPAGRYVEALGAKTMQFPKSNVQIEKSSTSAYGVVNEDAGMINQNGIQITSYLVDDLAKVAQDRAQVQADPNKKIDGAAQGANSEDKFIALGDNVQTKSMNTLPGGVDNSSLIGN
jgi:hypothetical protein